MGTNHNNEPHMTGNGKQTTYKNGDDWGMVNMTASSTHIDQVLITINHYNHYYWLVVTPKPY